MIVPNRKTVSLSPVLCMLYFFCSFFFTLLALINRDNREKDGLMTSGRLTNILSIRQLFANLGVNEAQNNKNVSVYAFPFTAFLTLHDLYILPLNFLLLYV